MKTDEFITYLRKTHNVTVESDNGKLKLKAAENVLTPELIESIKSRKEDILAFFDSLKNSHQPTTIPLATAADNYQLSAAQKRIYYVYELDKNSIAYNMSTAVRLSGALDFDKLASTFAALIQRHESLRTEFVLSAEGPVQRVLPEVPFAIERFRAEPGTQDELIRRFIRPFRLDQAPLLRVALITLAPDDYLLVVDMHHIITDGVSQGVLIRDFMALYNSEPLPELRLQYKDFAEWQQESSQQEQLFKQKKFWLNEFSDGIDLLHLPTDFERPVVKTYAGKVADFDLTAEAAGKLKQLAHQENATLFFVYLAIYNVLLGKLSNQEAVVVGSSTAGRSHADLEHIIGMFVNTLPLRNLPQGDLSFRAFLQDVKTRGLECFNNQEYSYAKLIDDLKVTRDAARNPLFDIVFDFQNLTDDTLVIPGLSLAPYQAELDMAKFDLGLTVAESDDAAWLRFEYATDLFEPATIERFITYFKAIVAAVTANPDVLIADILLLTAAEKQLLLEQHTSMPACLEKGTVLALFQEQVSQAPDAIAVAFEDKQLSYQQLDELSNQLAHNLRETYAIEPDDLIGIEMDKNEWLIVAILGILKAGAAYVPIDPTYPAERKKYIASNAGIKLMISEMDHLFKLDHFEGRVMAIDVELDRNKKVGEVQHLVQPQHLAYIIYTSGSTGEPKGVMIEHSSLLNYASWAAAAYLDEGKGTFSLFTSISFDLTVTSIFTALITGNKIVVYKEDDKTFTIEQVITDPETNVIKLTPSHLRMIASLDLQGRSLGDQKRVFIVGGEQLETQLAGSIYKKFGGNVAIYNEYGPTEATVGCMIHAFDPQSQSFAVPIGVPIWNTQVYVLGRQGELLPAGTPGELCLAGAGLARGYLHNPALSQQRFRRHAQLPGAPRLYHTGDVCRWQADGTLLFVGRNDAQLKLRGFRIEPAEIEAQLSRYDALTGALVQLYTPPVTEDNSAEGGRTVRQLVAYYTAPAPVAAAQLQQHLRQRLPAYMVPEHFLWLAQWPLTPNGKVDRRALPAPALAAASGYQAPATAAEALLAQLWAQVLGRPRVGVHDDFFAAGGDSIKSIQISARLLAAGYEASVKDIFVARTIRRLAPLLRAAGAGAEQGAVVGAVALTPIQRWFLHGSLVHKAHFNQSVLLNFAGGLGRAQVQAVFGALLAHHDALRLRFAPVAAAGSGQLSWQQTSAGLAAAGAAAVAVHEVDLRGAGDVAAAVLAHGQQLQAGLDLAQGPLLGLGLFHTETGSRLLVVVHHLVVDAVSWRILFEDIEQLYGQLRAGQPLRLPAKTSSFQQWANALTQYAAGKQHAARKSYWQAALGASYSSVERDYPTGSNTPQTSRIVAVHLDKDRTEKLLKKAHRAFNTQINDLLLAAFLLAMHKHYGYHSVLVDLESHGREDIAAGINVSRTVGWFTSIYPVLLALDGPHLATAIRNVKETLRRVPANGIDYLLHQFGDDSQEEPFAASAASISFNYLGQFDTDVQDRAYTMATEPRGDEMHPDEQRLYDWDVMGLVSGGTLELAVKYSEAQYRPEGMEKLMQHFQSAVEELVDYCSNYQGSLLSPADMTYPELSLAQLDELQQQYAVEDVYTLSPMQEGMLFHALIEPDSASYFEQTTLHVAGHLDAQDVERSMNDLLQRHTVLRTAFVHAGYSRPLQVVLRHRTIDFTVVDLREAAAQHGVERSVAQYQQQIKQQPFDLGRDVLMRLCVLRVAEAAYVLIWSHHHIIMDGWCMSIMLSEFRALYAAHRQGSSCALPPVAPYADYMRWLAGIDQQAGVEYWKDYLRSYTTLATLPGKKEVAGKRATATALATKSLLINAELTAGLHKLSGKYGVTLNSIIQLAWSLLLRKYNGVDDVVFGTIVSGRPASVPGIETMVGLFINIVPVRVQLADTATVGQVLEQVQANALEGEQHQYHPFAEIQAASPLGRNLLDHILVFENYPVADKLKEQDEHQHEYRVTAVDLFEQTTFDLAVLVVPGDTLTVKIDYKQEAYDAVTIDSILEQLQTVVEQLAHDQTAAISEIQVLSESRQQALAKALNDTAASYPATETIVSLFAKQARATPDQPAVYAGEEVISYRQLNDRAEAIARYLVGTQAVAPGDLVGVMLEREEQLLPVIMGILKAGAAYVPIDPHLPKARIQAIIDNSGMSCVVTRPRFNTLPLAAALVADPDHMVQAAAAANVLLPTVSSTDLAYVIYTSGTTGVPKGVMIEHHSVINRLLWMQKNYPLSSQDVILQKTPIGFDVSVWELFWWSFAGASVCLLAPGAEKEPAEIVAAINRHKVTTLHFVPSMLTLFLSSIVTADAATAEQLASLRLVFASGEALQPEQVNQFRTLIYDRHNTRLINLYGPTEATVDVSYSECDLTVPCTKVTIGKPIDNTRLYVLDKDNQLAPPEVPGELCIAGVNLARGYLNNAALTSEKFTPNPILPGERIYRTGDLVKWQRDGNIDYLGRIDHQVKIRGNRIELGEIENHLNQQPTVSASVVVAAGDAGDKYLVAYYAAETALPVAQLKAHLAAHVPEYMVPAFYVHLPEMPLSANGKIDRKALPAHDVKPKDNYKAPTTPAAHTLVAIWADVLRLNAASIGEEDDFFLLGGHSIKAIKLANEINSAFSVQLKLRDIFENSTVEKQVALVQTAVKDGGQPALQTAVRDVYPLSSAQERIFYAYLQNADSLMYNISGAYAIEGNVDKAQLASAFQALVDRHESLRTSFTFTEDGPVQQIAEQVTIKPCVIDAAEHTDLSAAFAAFVKPFDLAQAPLIRYSLLEHAQLGTLLLIDVHHIICDGISLNILMSDFKKLYQGEAINPPAFRYVDYAVWQRNASGHTAQQRAFWSQQLRGELLPLDLPVSQSRATATDVQVAGVEVLAITGELYDAVKAHIAAAKVSDFVFLLSAYYLLLSKITGNTDIIIGIDAAGRSHSAFDEVVGTFINILPIRMQLDTEQPCAEFVQDVKRGLLEAYDHQDFQYDEMMAMLAAEGRTERKTIVDVHFALANFFDAAETADAIRYNAVELLENRTTTYEFKIEVAEQPGQYAVQFIYSKALYSPDIIELMMLYYKNILLSIVQDHGVAIEHIAVEAAV